MYIAITSALILLTIIVPFVMFYKGEKTKKSFKRTLITNIASFALVLLIIILTGPSAFAQGEAAQAAGDAMKFIAAALSVGLACIGAGIAVAAASAAALGAISENEGTMGKCLIFVALAEGIALYGLLISFMILNA